VPKKNPSAVNKARRIKRKFQLVMKNGGACKLCGYSKNLSSLAFHHKPGHLKKVELHGEALSSSKLEDIFEEAKKCVLICHNCHGEIHNPELDLKKIKKAIKALDSKIFTLQEFTFFLFDMKRK
jgi:hypothetical protein